MLGTEWEVIIVDSERWEILGAYLYKGIERIVWIGEGGIVEDI